MTLKEALSHSVGYVLGIVPKLDRRMRHIVLVAEPAQARCSKHEKFSSKWFQPKPPSSKHSEEVSARENQHIAFDGAHAINDTISAGADLFRRFSIRTTVTE